MIPWNGDVLVWWTIQESFVALILRKKEKFSYLYLFDLSSIFLSLFAPVLNSTSRLLSTGCVFNLKYTQPNKNMFSL